MALASASFSSLALNTGVTMLAFPWTKLKLAPIPQWFPYFFSSGDLKLSRFDKIDQKKRQEELERWK